MALDILFILLLILANGMFAMSEIAVVSARKARLQQLVNEGNTKARAALELANAPNRFLSTAQIGITLVGILAGAMSLTQIYSSVLRCRSVRKANWRLRSWQLPKCNYR